VATFTEILLSGSSYGRNIKVAATSSPGTTIHTGSSTPGVIDKVYLYAANTDTTARKLTIQFGGTTDPDDHIELTIPAESGAVYVIDGWPIGGNATPLVVKAFASVANVININGYVHRIA